MKKFMLALLTGVFLVSGAYAANESVQRFYTGSTQIWDIDAEGDVTAAGSVTTSTVTLSGSFAPASRTIAQLNAIAPSAAGLMFFCSDCTRSAVCVSSGTGTGAWTVSSSTGAAPSYKTIHCQ